jgi:hypothetical protein
MKSHMKLIIGLVVLSLLSYNQSNAQKASFPEFLSGEWTKIYQSGPHINDTITLTRELIESSKAHPRWKFVLPDKLIQQYFTDNTSGSTEVIAVAHSFKCNYDKKSKLLRIAGSEYDAYFKIDSKRRQP